MNSKRISFAEFFRPLQTTVLLSISIHNTAAGVDSPDNKPDDRLFAIYAYFKTT